MPEFKSKWSFRLILSGLLLTAWIFYLNFQLDLQHDRSSQEIVVLEETNLVPPLAVLQTINLGYDTLFADFIWFKSLNYFATHFFREREYLFLEDYVFTITDLDPYFKIVYEWGAVVIVSGRSSDADAPVETSFRILKKGMTYFPDYWRFPFLIGWDYMVEIHPKDPELKKEYKKRAIKYFQRASVLPGAPDDLAFSILSLYRALDDDAAQIAFVREAYLQSNNQENASLLLARLSALGGKEEAEHLQQERARISKEWLKNFGYIPPDLYIVISPRLDFTIKSDYIDADLDLIHSN